MSIKDFLPNQASFCEHTRDVVVCKVMTGKEYSGPDIWRETPNQGTDTEEINFTI